MAQEEIPDNPGVLFPPPFIYLGWLAAGFGVDKLTDAADFSLVSAQPAGEDVMETYRYVRQG